MDVVAAIQNSCRFLGGTSAVVVSHSPESGNWISSWKPESRFGYHESCVLLYVVLSSVFLVTSTVAVDLVDSVWYQLFLGGQASVTQVFHL